MRLKQLPIILAGPILRHTEASAVTVWLALRTKCEVTLSIYVTKQGISVSQPAIFQGKRPTVRLGEYLHIVAVTASSINGNPLESGYIYAYDLEFELPDNSRQTLIEALNLVNISYFTHKLPTFSLPPHDLNDLRIAQGSCRKPQGEGLDALPILDDIIEQNAQNPDTRIHQLFLTGDQIYGDDVADLLLQEFTEVGNTLLGWEEELSLLSTSVKPKELKPGQRSEIAEKEGGLTAGLRHKPERAKSHLMSWGEYCTTYLFFWSETLWPQKFLKTDKNWQKEVKELKSFAYTLDKVQRLFANVPTYMIFDDHDISDDWYLNQAWCLRVLGKPLGRQIVRNGLLAYAIFQAWGNTPEQFTEGQIGAKLLDSVEIWSASEGKNEAQSLAIWNYLGLPEIDSMTGLPLFQRDEDVLILKRGFSCLTWHYTVRTPNYEVLVLDTRTWRGYPANKETIAPPMLLSPTALLQQIQQKLKQTDIEATLVIAPTNLVSLKIIDKIQAWSLKQRKVFDNDVGDSWNLHPTALVKLLQTLFEQREQVIVFSGDIHYGSAVRLDFWQYPSKTTVLAQLTASSFCNAELKTRLVHTKLKSLLSEKVRHWVGWLSPLEVVEVQNQSYRSSPEISYRIEWKERQKAQFFGKNIPWLKSYEKARSNWHRHLKNFIAQLWRNRFLQEGKEVVGLNNVGLVSFIWSEIPNDRVIIFDLYWYPPWNATGIVVSRYTVSLESKKDE